MLDLATRVQWAHYHKMTIQMNAIYMHVQTWIFFSQIDFLLGFSKEEDLKESSGFCGILWHRCLFLRKFNRLILFRIASTHENMRFWLQSVCNVHYCSTHTHIILEPSAIAQIYSVVRKESMQNEYADMKFFSELNNMNILYFVPLLWVGNFVSQKELIKFRK